MSCARPFTNSDTRFTECFRRYNTRASAARVSRGISANTARGAGKNADGKKVQPGFCHDGVYCGFVARSGLASTDAGPNPFGRARVRGSHAQKSRRGFCARASTLSHDLFLARLQRQRLLGRILFVSLERSAGCGQRRVVQATRRPEARECRSLSPDAFVPRRQRQIDLALSKLHRNRARYRTTPETPGSRYGPSRCSSENGGVELAVVRLAGRGRRSSHEQFAIRLPATLEVARLYHPGDTHARSRDWPEHDDLQRRKIG